jgi:hypothetical protein
MYQGRRFSVRPLEETLEDIAVARRTLGDHVRKVFVMDGDALAMGLDVWEPILQALRDAFPRLRRVSCYATALNLLAKSQEELRRLRELGLSLLYIGPESGDDVTLKRIAKGATAMDPEFLSALTLMLIPTTPIYRLAESGRFELPGIEGILQELRTIVAETNPTGTIFHSNHASNYLPLSGRLPHDREVFLRQIDAALAGDSPLRGEWMRGL